MAIALYIRIFTGLFLSLALAACGDQREPSGSSEAPYDNFGGENKPGKGGGGLVSRNSYDMSLFTFKQSQLLKRSLKILNNEKVESCLEVGKLVNLPASPGQKRYSLSVYWNQCYVEVSGIEGQISGYEYFVVTVKDAPILAAKEWPFEQKNILSLEVSTQAMSAFFSLGDTKTLGYTWSLNANEKNGELEFSALVDPEEYIEFENANRKVKHRLLFSMNGRIRLNETYLVTDYQSHLSLIRTELNKLMPDKIEKYDLHLRGLDKIKFQSCDLLGGTWSSQYSVNGSNYPKGKLTSNFGQIYDSLSDTTELAKCKK